jgi:hypothetical protein
MLHRLFKNQHALQIKRLDSHNFFVNPLYHFSIQNEALWELHKGRSWLMKFQQLGSRDDPSLWNLYHSGLLENLNLWNFDS